jgi:hypothetical protein
MHLSTIDLYELGQYLRIVLWICVPLIVISLLVTTWLHYRRRTLYPAGWQLPIEGLDDARNNAPEPDPTSHRPENSLSYRKGVPDEHPIDNPDTLPAQRIPADNDQWAKEHITEGVTEWKGRDDIYQGILWMKAKYEQYRDQADQRYALLKEELNRLERRYQELLEAAPDKAALATLEMLYDQARQQLDARQLIIDDLEAQLRIERSMNIPKEAL